MQKKRLQHYSQTYQHRVDQFEADVPRTICLVRPVITISVGVTTRCPEDAFGSVFTGPTIWVNLTWEVCKTGSVSLFIDTKGGAHITAILAQGFSFGTTCISPMNARVPITGMDREAPFKERLALVFTAMFYSLIFSVITVHHMVTKLIR